MYIFPQNIVLKEKNVKTFFNKWPCFSMQNSLYGRRHHLERPTIY